MSEVELIRTTGKCCCCRSALIDSENLNLVICNRKAKWAFPVAGNFLTGETGFAIAINCDRCVADGRTPLFAVELRDQLLMYHPIRDLEVHSPKPNPVSFSRQVPNHVN